MVDSGVEVTPILKQKAPELQNRHLESANSRVEWMSEISRL
jgi:hypothetical protein